MHIVFGMQQLTLYIHFQVFEDKGANSCNIKVEY